MKLLLVRHAEPDYAIDGLTEKGKVEAELLSRRLAPLDPQVTAYYCSPLGRACRTAEYTLNKVGRTAEILPWLAEFRGREYDPMAGRERIPWDFRPCQWKGKPLLHHPEQWVEDPLFEGGTVGEIWEETKAGVDALLARHGYVRDGQIFRCDDNREDIIVMFCHFGILTAVLGAITGLSPMPLWHAFCAAPSSVTTLVTEERVKGEVVFRCSGFGDISHLYAGGEPMSTAALYCEVYDGRDSTRPIAWDLHQPD